MVMRSLLNIRLWRELNQMRMQVLAIALVMAAGIATFVMSFGVIASVDETRRVYYDQYRCADNDTGHHPGYARDGL